MRRISAVLLAVVTSLSSIGHATPPNHYVTNKTVTRVGVNPGSNFAYFVVAEAMGQNDPACQGGLFYIKLDDANAVGKSAYALILSAKSLGKQLSYLAFSFDSVSSQCWVIQVEMAG